MSARNPHDRRDRRGDEIQIASRIDLGWAPVRGPGSRPESPLAMEDLEAMVASAIERSAKKWRPVQQAAEREAVQNARRVAWEEGYAAGERDGRGLLLAIDRLHGGAAREALKAGRAIVERSEGQEIDGADVAIVRSHHRLLVELLGRLVDSHHAEFAEDLPF